jgi:hypothetical protein
MVTRLSGGLTPADGSDPRTFPAIWNVTADDIEDLQDDSIPTNVITPVAGELLRYDGTNWVNVGVNTALGAGKILQVVQALKTDTQVSSVASAGTVAVSGLSSSITPTATSSKVLVIYDLSGSHSAVGYSIILRRDSTSVSLGDAEGVRTQVTSGGNILGASDLAVTVSSATVLDSPNTTSAVAYTLLLHNNTGSLQTLTVNRSVTETNLAARARSASRITLMEVAG